MHLTFVACPAPAYLPPSASLGLVVILGAIMSVLDTTIVNVALDTLGHGAHRAVPLPPLS